MLSQTLLAFLALTTLATAYNVRIYSDKKCTKDLNWAGIGQSSTCEPWESWFSPGAFILDAAVTDDSTIVVFTDSKECNSEDGHKFLVANSTAGCTEIPSWAHSVQVQNFTESGGKKVPKTGPRKRMELREVKWLG